MNHENETIAITLTTIKKITSCSTDGRLQRHPELKDQAPTP